MQADATTHAQQNKQLYEERDDNAAPGYTLDKSFPAVAEDELLTVTYYDAYFGYASEAAYPFVPDEVEGVSTHNEQVRGQVTGTRTRVLGSSDWLTSVTYYDQKYRPIQIITDTYVGGTVLAKGERMTTRYDFVGKALEIKTTHQTLTGSHTITQQMDTTTWAGC